MGIFNFLKSNKRCTENKANIVISYEPPEFDVNMSLLDLNIPSTRDQFVLLLIAKTGMNNPRSLGFRLDMCDFPGNENKSVSNLVSSKLVYIAKANGWGHPIRYAVTTFGEEFLKNHIVRDEIIEYIKQMSNPDFMLELVKSIFDKMQPEQ